MMKMKWNFVLMKQNFYFYFHEIDQWSKKQGIQNDL